MSTEIRMPGTGPTTSFGPLKQIDAGELNVGYTEAGPADGPAVLLLHGWPYDIHSYVEVTPLLAARGYRVIVPYLRGYGTTRFLSGAVTEPRLYQLIRQRQPIADRQFEITILDAEVEAYVFTFG
jgi:pimeloyl-ACP methyl ester carboxylesterase